MAGPDGSCPRSPPSSSQLTAGGRSTGRVDAEAPYAWAETALRTGLTIITVVAATDTVFALAAGGGAVAAVEGIVLTGIGIAGGMRIDVAARVLRPRGRMVLLATVFAVGGLLDVGLQGYFAEVAVAIVCVAALICTARWVTLCCVVSAAGFLGALVLHGRSMDWIVGDGRYVVAGQLVNLAANASGGLLIIALLRRFLAEAPRMRAAVRAGGGSLTPQLALAAGGGSVLRLPAADSRTLVAALTPAERAVVELLAAGRAPKQTAGDLSIALPTVRSRIAAAKRKTGARTIEHLVALYAGSDGA